MEAMKVRWTTEALTQLEVARRCIQREGAVVASETITGIQDVMKLLLQFPHLGRPGRTRGTREAVIAGTPYVLVYAILRDTVAILTVFRRGWYHPRMTEAVL